jgi:hypothetical protein
LATIGVPVSHTYALAWHVAGVAGWLDAVDRMSSNIAMPTLCGFKVFTSSFQLFPLLEHSGKNAIRFCLLTFMIFERRSESARKKWWTSTYVYYLVVCAFDDVYVIESGSRRPLADASTSKLHFPSSTCKTRTKKMHLRKKLPRHH